MSDQPRDENGRFVRKDTDWVLYHLESLIKEHQRAHDQRHAADQEALTRARESMETQQEKLRNEFKADLATLRGEFRGDRRDFLTKSEFSLKAETFSSHRTALSERIGNLEKDAASGSAVENVKRDLKIATNRFRWSLAGVAVSLTVAAYNIIAG